MPGCSKCKPGITGEGILIDKRSAATATLPAGAGKGSLPRILDLSWRISHYAPPMKPFLRFSQHADTLFKGQTGGGRLFFWDFDDALQKILLGMARTLATPADIGQACVERWKINLESLYQKSKSRLETLRKNGEMPRFRTRPRSEFIFSRVAPGRRLLYIGCGSGSDCLGWAQRGYDVVGIDTDAQLVGIANEWAEYLKLPFQALCMDAESITFSPGSFDGFLLEFYGFQPSLAQALALQRGLANTLNDNGLGFIVATRKKYASFWHKMSSFRYPEPMYQWLKSQSHLDHCFSPLDACEEKLAFGLYIRSHTIDSLSSELAGVFAVQECQYEEHDPRYLISVVKRKGCFADPQPAPKNDIHGDWPRQVFLPGEGVSVEAVLDEIHALCDLLKTHKDKVERFFLEGGVSGVKNPLSMLVGDLPRFIERLGHIQRMQRVTG
jgi:SAM-dependent methyltransferase